MENREKHLFFRAENLAVPEIITAAEPGAAADLELDDELEELEIQYETLAVPEIHTGKRKA